MLPTPSTIQPVPVRERFPNRYTGGYCSSIVTERLKREIQASTRAAPLNTNSSPGVGVGRR